ncbi:MAG: PAS domain S-box protein, partial [Chloroflexota bacterium]
IKEMSLMFGEALTKGVEGRERCFQKKNGERFWVEITGVVVREGDKFKHFLSNWVNITERKQAEGALQQSEEKLRLMFESLSLGVVVTDLNGKILQVNEAKVRMHGYGRKEELLGRNLLELIAEKDHARVIENRRRRLESGSSGSVEYTYLRKDGSEFPGEASSSLLRDASGEPIGLISITEDITERKRVEEVLRQSEEKLRLMFESLSLGVVVADRNGVILQVNEAKVRMHGYDSKEELIGRSIAEFAAEKDRARAMDNRRRKFENGYSGSVEYTYLRKDGSEFPAQVSSAVLRDASGNPVGLISISEDIIERKRMEEVLRQSEEKLRAIFDSLALGVIVSDLNGKILELNKAKVRTHGYDSKEELIGRSLFELISEKDRARVVDDRRQTLEHGYSESAEYTYLRKDGSEFIAQVSRTVLKDVSGEPIEFITITEDITERKRMQEHLILTDRLASIGELASGIAHELNNPLTSVIGFSELLLEKKDIPVDIREDLEVINREANRTAGVVRNLLTFARKHAPTKQPVDIAAVIKNVLELRAYEQRINNIQVNTHFFPGLPEVMADGFQLQQVFLNIIINAEFFMIETHGRGALTITTEPVGDIIRASFADDGPGIPKENLSHIFDPFFTTKEVGKGTGLGLSICHGIIAEHGGRIYAESELGKGATFIVELPVSKQ